MLKLVLLRVLYDLIEEMVTLEARLTRARLVSHPHQRVVFDHLAQQLEVLKAGLLQERAALKPLLLDQLSADNDCHRLLSVVFPKLLADHRQLTETLYQIDQRQLPSEATQFLSSLRLSKLVSVESASVVLIPTAHREGVYLEDHHLMKLDHNQHWAIIQDIGLLALSSPLQWFGLTDYFMQAFALKTPQLHGLIEDLQEHMQPADFPVDMICPLLNLRLLGPSYYAYYVLEGLKEGYQPWFWIVEPLLFQGLNRFGFINKDLVILHQSLEKAKLYVEDGMEDSDELSLSDKDREALLSISEKIIPDALAFVEKQYHRAQLLQDRLEQGVLISAVPMMSNPLQLFESLEELPETQAITPLLKDLRESPAKPIEILNAGMLYKLDQAPNWLKYAFSSLDDEAFWTYFQDKALSLSDVLAKSIETAQVFDMVNDDGMGLPPVVPSGASLQALRLQESART